MYKIKKRVKVQKQRSRRIAQYNPGLSFSDAVTYTFASRRRAFGVVAGSMAITGMVIGTANALPTGGNVVGGSAPITQPNAATMNINQVTDKAILNWNGFSINVNELVKFVQPGVNSVILNRVVGADPSSILGQLQANGKVFLINPNGILFGQSSKVDVGGLLATTFDISNEDFMSGKYVFNQDPSKNSSFVINKGEIKIADNGFVFLVAPAVSNEGLIIASLGQVVLGAGNKLTVDFFGDGLITYAVEGKVFDQVTGPDGQPLSSAVSNSGTVKADGGTVLLTADASNALLSSVVNQSGIIEAKSFTDHEGQIILQGRGEGLVSNTGTLDTLAAEAGAGNGFVEMSGEHVMLGGSFLAGTILIDPDYMTIVDQSACVGSDIFCEGDLESTLQGGSNVVIEAEKGITVADLTTDGVINGTNSGAGGALTLRITNKDTDGAGTISFVDNSDEIRTDGALLLDAQTNTAGTGGTLVNIGSLTSTGSTVTLLATGDIGIENDISTAGNLITIGSTGGSININNADVSSGSGDIEMTAGVDIMLTSSNVFSRVENSTPDVNNDVTAVSGNISLSAARNISLTNSSVYSLAAANGNVGGTATASIGNVTATSGAVSLDAGGYIDLDNSSVYSKADAHAYTYASASNVAAAASIGNVTATSGAVNLTSGGYIRGNYSSVYSEADASAFSNAAAYAQGYTYGNYAYGATATASIGSVSATSGAVTLTAGGYIDLDYSTVYSEADAYANSNAFAGAYGYYAYADNATASTDIGTVSATSGAVTLTAGGYIDLITRLFTPGQMRTEQQCFCRRVRLSAYADNARHRQI
jgi:filamentous hemagglutinin family protein